ncbi:MAG: hypothetical protein U0230_14610 [Polyangiales bacterium]
MRFLASVSLAVLVSACAASPPRVVAPTTALGPSRALSGHVRYEARSATPTGVSTAIETRPARYVTLVFVDAQGVERARGRSDGEGAYRVDVPADVARVRILSEASVDGYELSVSPDGRGRGTHVLERPLATDATTLDVLALDASPDGEGGALHLLDTMLRGALAVHEWTGAPLPPLYAYWARGVTSTWSYYHGERPEGSGRFSLELMGGERGARETTDTDEHDEPIVLHEVGHFVFDRLSSDSSMGGDHPGGTLIDPGLSWEEGRATWFAGVVLGSPRYRDTIGMEPRGQLRVDRDLERRESGPIGIGSESTVMEVLWDLSDGSPGLPDRDDDGVALAPADLMRAMIDLGRTPGAYPCLATFLTYLVERGIVGRPALADMLGRGGHPAGLLPPAGEVPWPLALALGAPVAGKIDGLTEPAPSGGPARPQNGLDAVRSYRLEIPVRGWLELELRIDGSGRAADRQDLDLELRSIRADLLGSSREEEKVERLGRFVEPGYYVVVVRDGGQGNRAGYRLTATMGR